MAELYTQNCAGCHGRNLDGGRSISLLGQLRHGTEDNSLFHSIRTGFPRTGMPAFSALSDADIRALVIYLRELRGGANGQNTSGRDFDKKPIELPAGVQKTEVASYRLEKVVNGIGVPYSFAVLPNGRILVTEKPAGTLRIVENGKLSEPVLGIPVSHKNPDGDYTPLDVILNPQYRYNGWIYLSLGAEDAVAHPADPANGEIPALTKIVRGKIRENRWVDEQVIWKADSKYFVAPSDYYAGRMVFDRRGHLFFSFGVNEEIRDKAQDLDSPKGKIHRIFDDGRVPNDNPFAHRKNAVSSVWSYGHRNPQGIAIDPRTGFLWSSEHGPRGGDELNLITNGGNYGWPIVTFGINYDGTPITENTSLPGMVNPIVEWTPAPAVSAIEFYTGNKFLKWQNNLFITSLKGESLFRFVIDGKKVVHRETILKDIGRLREIKTGPDGFIYLLVEIHSTRNPRLNYIVRLVPAKSFSCQ